MYSRERQVLLRSSCALPPTEDFALERAARTGAQTKGQVERPIRNLRELLLWSHVS